MRSHYINGQWIKGSGKTFQSLNPADRSVLWEGCEATDKEVSEAIEQAKKSFESWRLEPLERKLPIFEKFKSFLTRDKESFARLISDETGKPYWECLTEVGAMIGKLDISLKTYEQRCQTQSQDIPAGGQSITRYKPIGPMVVFGPFNLPVHLPNGHILPALIAGNTIVFKPSEQTPACCQKMIELWHEAGLAKGVLNMVQGSKETGIALCKHPDIRGVLFTGSYPTGAAIHRSLAGRPEVILALEMGGNNPLLVWDCKDIKAAAYTIIQSAFITSGQRCVCARRLILPDSEYGDQLLDELLKQTKRLRIGLPQDKDEPFMGPLISEQAAKLCIQDQKQLIHNGAKVLLESTISERCSALVKPGILDVSSLKNLDDEETFGPLLKVIRVKNFEDGIQAANQTEYGLSAGLISDNPKLYEAYRNHSQAGILNWNRQITGAVSSAPFGGSGKSGNFRPSAAFAADYCAFPVASIEIEEVSIPEKLAPGVDPS